MFAYCLYCLSLAVVLLQSEFFTKAEVVVMDSGPLPGYFNKKENNNIWAIATILKVWPK